MLNTLGHIRNGVVVFDEPTQLKDGTPVRIEVIAPAVAPLPIGRVAAASQVPACGVGDTDEIDQILAELQSIQKVEAPSGPAPVLRRDEESLLTDF